MNLDLGIPVFFGGVDATIYGGPFKQYKPGTRRLIGVKMAREIERVCEIDIPTYDFSVPDAGVMGEGVLEALRYILEGNDIYAGCMGGIGRTGLFMGCMAKVMEDYATKTNSPHPAPSDPVLYVREHYKSHAIETDEQQDFVRSFDTTEAVRYLADRLEPKVKVRTEVRIEYLDRPVYLSPLAWVKMKLGMR